MNWMLLNEGAVAVFTERIQFLNCTKDKLLRDTAHALSNLNRAGGRFNWCVGRHQMLVAFLTPHVLSLEARIHDMHESITGDIPTPWKKWLPQEVQSVIDQAKAMTQREMERMIGYEPLADSLLKTAGIIDSPANVVAHADLLAFYYECERFRSDSRDLAASDVNLVVPPPPHNPVVDGYMQFLIDNYTPGMWINSVKRDLDERKAANAAEKVANVRS